MPNFGFKIVDKHAISLAPFLDYALTWARPLEVGFYFAEPEALDLIGTRLAGASFRSTPTATKTARMSSICIKSRTCSRPIFIRHNPLAAATRSCMSPTSPAPPATHSTKFCSNAFLIIWNGRKTSVSASTTACTSKTSQMEL